MAKKPINKGSSILPENILQDLAKVKEQLNNGNLPQIKPSLKSEGRTTVYPSDFDCGPGTLHEADNCCIIDQYLAMTNSSGEVRHLAIANAPGTYCYLNPDNASEYLTEFSHTMQVFSGYDLGDSYCCMPNDVTNIEYLTDGSDTATYQVDYFNFCNGVRPGFQEATGCNKETTTGLVPWEFTYFNGGTQQISPQSEWTSFLCDLVLHDEVQACSMWGILGPGEIQTQLCMCPNTGCLESGDCDPNVPCNDGGGFYCNTNNMTSLGGTCAITDECGVCNGTGYPEGVCDGGVTNACNCQGGCPDVCGVCEGGASEWFDEDSGQTYVIFQSHSGVAYCDCGTAETPEEQPTSTTNDGGANQVQVVTCYREDAIIDVPIEFYHCGEGCPEGYTQDPAEVADPGCKDPEACNYSDQFENDCNNDPDGTNYDCCVYPQKYCKDNYEDVYPSDGSVPDGAGYNGKCDVYSDGTPEVDINCPVCNNPPTPDQPGCGIGYTELAPWNPTSPAALTYGQLNEDNLTDSGGAYIWAAARFDEEISDAMLDTDDFGLTGCNDPAALNYGDVEVLYYGDDINGPIETQFPVVTCEYCPTGQLAIALNCPSGYEFIWNNDLPETVSTTNTVRTPNQNGYNPLNPFHINQPSNVFDNGDNIGSCFCKDDLQFLEDMGNTISGYDNNINHPLQLLDQSGGVGALMHWSTTGQIEIFASNNIMHSECGTGNADDCRSNGPQFGTAVSQIPSSVANLKGLKTFNISHNYFDGSIPADIFNLVLVENVDLSYNYFNSFPTSDHYVSQGTISNGVCTPINRPLTGLGVPEDVSNNWLSVKGNMICPEIYSQYNGTTSYPECLVPPVYSDEWSSMTDGHQDWVYKQLGFIELPNYDQYNYIDPAQYITDEEGNILEGVCDIIGCMQPEARNYWPEATTDCGDACCEYDNYYHFPFGNTYGPPGGSFGGDMELFDMIQALHAYQYGFQYNAWGDLDVTNSTPTSYGSFCDGIDDYWISQDVINNCELTFYNDPSNYPSIIEASIPSSLIDHYDGIWLRNSGYRGELPIWRDELFDGDARPLEFINRVRYEAEASGNVDAFISQWIFLHFPHDGRNESFFGIQWLEDYTQYGNDNELGEDDYTAWRLKGRDDIADMIQYNLWNPNWPEPVSRPEDSELWETTEVHVSMSYSKKFISESDVGYTVYPDEEGSTGTLRRSGQWQCADGGDSSVCYDFSDACGRAPSWYDECVPCGNEESADELRQCIPLTLDIAAEGHEKISKTQTQTVSYFGDKSVTDQSYIAHSSLYTGSLSSSNHPYYVSVMNGDPNSSKSDTVFDISWGHYAGSGSDTKDNQIKSPTEAIYKQYASLLLDDKLVDDGFFISSGSDVRTGGIKGDSDKWIYILNFKRKYYEDQLQAGTWTLQLSGSSGGNGKTIKLTDDSLVNITPTITSQIGKRYNIISGSAGSPVDGYNPILGRYGFYYPDAGLMVFGEKISHEMSGSGEVLGTAVYNTTTSESRQLIPNLGDDSNSFNALRFFNCMKNNTATSPLTLYGEKEVTNVIYVCRLDATEFNHTNNFSILSGSGRQMYSVDTGVMNGFNTAITSSAFTGSVGQPSSPIISGSVTEDGVETITLEEDGTPFIHPGGDIPTMYGKPTTFITGIELYNQYGTPVAVARLSKPFKKSVDRESIIKVKLTY